MTVIVNKYHHSFAFSGSLYYCVISGENLTLHPRSCLWPTTNFNTSNFSDHFLSGILLIFHGMNKEVNLTIVLGSLVLAVPTCVVIPSCLAFKYYRKLWREKRDEQRDKRKTYQYDNPFKSESELEL